MIITNPIYDVVFKFLMEDLDIAKGLIGSIIGEEIIEMHFAAQEVTTRRRDHSLALFRLDFVATIRTQTGRTRKALIELQKSRLTDDAQRFRNYLGKQYQKTEDTIQPDGAVHSESLPIIAIYILGFDLEKHLPAMVKVNREYLDMITQEPVKGASRFIEALSHDTYVIQALKLHHNVQSDLERILSIFGQDHFADEKKHRIDFPEQYEKSELLQKMLRRLHKAAAGNIEILDEMDDEDAINREIELGYLEREAKLKQRFAIAQKNEKIAQREKAEAKKLEAEAKRRETEERHQKEEAQKREAEAKQREKEAKKREKEAQQRILELEAMLNEERH